MTDYQKSKLPFNIVSSSVNTGYITEISSGFKSGVDIVGHHQDTYSGLENEPLQSPFTRQHVGGNQHRHISINTGNDNDFNRPEAFKIKPESGQLKIYGPDFENVHKPRAQNWLGAKSPLNISNIETSGNIAGNFEYNYQVIQTVGRRTTNNLINDGFIASGNLTTQFISGANNYSLPEINNNSDSIIVERFNSPGGKEESSRGALDRAGEELSANNSLTTRNIKIRQPFYSQLTKHSSQFGSSSLEGISIHKINRNGIKRIQFSGSGEIDYISSSLYDNFWVQHNIPANNFGYAWITSSTISNPYTLGTGSLQFAFTSSFVNIGNVDLASQTLSGSLSASQQAYGTWEQIRTGEHPVAKKQREVNIISVEDQSLPSKSSIENSLNISKRGNTSTNFIEPPITIKNYPIKQNILFVGDLKGNSTKLKYTFKNNSSRFANEDLDKKLGLIDKQVDFYNKLVTANNLENNSPITEILSLSFKETLYPRELNTYLSGTRGRTAYILDQSGSGVDGYDRRLGTQRVFWRDEQEKRKRTKNSSGGHINSLGYSSVLQSGSSFSANETTNLADESSALYYSTFNTFEGLDTNLFNSILPLENTSSETKSYTSEQVATFGSRTIFTKKLSNISYIAGEFNEQFVDSYGTSGSADGLLNNNLGSIYRRSYYKSITQQPPYLSGSADDQVDSVILIPTEDNEIQINPKPRYLSFLGGVQILNNSNIISRFEDQEENIFQQPEEGFITEQDIVYSDIDNGLLRKTEEISGKKPFFDSYEEFISDARNMGQDYSVVPEFRISEHMNYYVSSSGGNFRAKNNALFQLDGNGISNRSALTEKSDFNIDFKNKYLFSDELENNQIIEKDFAEDIQQESITLKLKGIKKLLPYNGFYPQDRTLQLANLYSEYAKKNLVGGLYNVSYEENTRDDELFAHTETTASLNSVSSLSSIRFSSSLDGDSYYIAVGHHSFDSYRGSVKIFKSTTDSPFDDWEQESIAQYTGDTINSYFGQSVLFLSASNGLNLYVTEFGQNKTGSIYQITSSDGINWSNKQKIKNSGNDITGSVRACFGNYLDGIKDNNKSILAITETGVPISFEDGAVRATYLSGTDLYIGGEFKYVNGDPTLRYLVKFDTINYNITRVQGMTNNVQVLTASNEKLYVGGGFSSVSNNGVALTKSAGIAVYNMNTGLWEDAKLGDMQANRSIRAIHLSGTDMYIGGTFEAYTGSSGPALSAKRIIKINNYNSGTPTFNLLGDSISNGLNNIPYMIQSSGSDIYVGGLFTTAYDSVNTSGKLVNYIARWNQIDQKWYYYDGLDGGYITGSYTAGSSTNTSFGQSIAVSDDGLKLFVGSPYFSTSGLTNRGQVRVYTRPNTSSQFTLAVSFAGSTANDNYGYSVDCSGDGNLLLIGIPRNSLSTQTGQARLIINPTSVSPTSITINSPFINFRKFGWSVAISKDKKYCVISGPSGSSGAGVGGHISLYRLSTSPTLSAVNEASFASSTAFEFFGDSVAIGNDTKYHVVAGSPGTSSARGRVYIYNSSSGGWGSTVSINNPTSIPDDGFGKSVAIAQSTMTNRYRIVVGNQLSNKVYLFDSGSSVGIGWINTKTFNGSDYGANEFGSKVSIAGTSTTNEEDLKYISISGIDSNNVSTVYLFKSGSHLLGDKYQNNWYSVGPLYGTPFNVNSTFSYVGTDVKFTGDGQKIFISAPGENVSYPDGVVFEYQANSFGWLNITGGLNGVVRTSIKSGSDIYIGGDFTKTNNNGSDNSGVKTLNRVAKLNTILNKFENLGNGHNGSVHTLVVSGNNILAGGSFTTTGSRVSVWNGANWTALSDNINNNNVYTLSYSSSNIIFAGGDFTSPSRQFGIYNINSDNKWLTSIGKVHIISANDPLDPTGSWSQKITVISGSNIGKYCSIISASSGYHVYTTEQNDDRGAIRVVSSSDGGTIWSFGASGLGSSIRSGSDTASQLGNLPIDATVFTHSGQERVYIFTADKGLNASPNGRFYVFSSSVGSDWNGVSPTSSTNRVLIKTGSSTQPIILADSEYTTNKTNVNISSLTASNVLYYSFGIPSGNLNISKVYVGRSYDGLSFENENNLFQSQPANRTTNYGENIDISNISNAIPIFFTNDFINVYSLVKGKFVIYRLNVEGNEKYVEHAALEPLFAPGILYNTIKSGIAVDWPCTTGSNVIVKSAGTYGLRSAYYPKNLTIKTIDSPQGILNAQGALKSIINYRIPFENIIFPNELFEPKKEIKNNQYTLKPIDAPDISSTDIVNEYLNKSYIYSGYETYINPLEVTDLANLGPKRYSSPFVYRKYQVSDSGLYTLSVSNFLAETIKFFLRDEKLVTFSSLPDNKWKEFKAGTTYYMDVVLEKTPDLVMMEAYSSSIGLEPRNNKTFNGRYFGYPVNKTNKNVWTGEAFSLEESAEIHSDPAYAPYTPPYFEGVARARIAFTPLVNRSYKLEEILNESVITNIFPGIEESISKDSDAYVNKMPINSSIDLKGSAQAVNVTIRNDSSGQQISEDPNNKIWIISPKMETPVLDFSNQTFEQYENEYIKRTGYGRGMWSGYGEIPSGNKGIRVRLEYPFARIQSNTTASLLEQVGFLAEEKNVGKIAENKTISEAIVVVPYLEKETDRTVKNKTSFRKQNIHFIKINKEIFNSQKKKVEDGTSETNSISDMIIKMKNYVIPPEMNLLEYPDLHPHVMYIFEFNHTLDQQDLSDIWQGLMPSISINAEKDEITINHQINKLELFGEEGIPQEIKFLVFKVKKKAEFNYFNVTATTKDDSRFQFNKIIGRKQGTDIYSYNWPYDYFSLVELAKMDIEINYKKKDNNE